MEKLIGLGGGPLVFHTTTRALKGAIAIPPYACCRASVRRTNSARTATQTFGKSLTSCVRNSHGKR
jgi:hypothetical protein